jgi:palmitoyltransferase
MRLCNLHPIRYFFNLKLDEINELSLFHKIIILENNSLFNSLIDFFSNKFKEEMGQLTSKDSNSPKGSRDINSKLSFYQIEEKKTSDTEYPNDLTLTKLLSLPDKDGNTPMLFAAYKGNLDIIIKLIDLGVKYDVRNKAGLDVIQMAAQNDMAHVIIFFKEKYNFDLFMPDLLGNNSLHWACSNCSKLALGYLLFYIDDKNADIINSVNKNNQTALHLTILTNESISIIKKLIKKGIKLDIKDKFGMTVFDIAKNNPKYEHINKTLIEYTQTNCLGLNYHKNDFKNKYFKFFMFIIFFLSLFYCTNAFCLPYIDENMVNQSAIKYIFNALSLVFVCYYFYILNSNPGIIKEKKSETLLELVTGNKSIKKLCPFCMVDQKNYSKHCFICNNCIEIYDHHCHWINNCIGAVNKKQFIGFLCVLLSIIFIDYFISLQVFILPMTEQYKLKDVIMSRGFNKYIISGLMGALNLFFVFPVSYIIYNQIHNECPPKVKKNEVKEYYEELKEINEKDNMVNHLQIKED